MKERILLIQSCSSKKSECAAQVQDFFKGQLFGMLKKLAIEKELDWVVLSGKYGLLKPTDVVEPYDSKIENKKDIERIKVIALPVFEKLIKNYDNIIVLMGENYRAVIESLYDDRFIVITHSKGIFGYLPLVSRFNKMSKEEFLKAVKLKSDRLFLL